jgi:DNA-binding protein HU-beta
MAKASTVSKTRLVDEVAASTGVSKKDARAVIEVLFNHIGEHLSRGDKVQVTGLGTFEVRERKAREGVKPREGRTPSKAQATARHHRDILPPSRRGRYDLAELTEIAKKLKEANR